MDISELLAFAAQHDASDLHLSAGLPPMLRVQGDIRALHLPPLSHAQVQAMMDTLMSDAQRQHYQAALEVDFAVELPGIARFRVNAFHQDRGAAAVLRTIPTTLRSLEALGAPAIFAELAQRPRGLVLVTGPTGSGKTTTLYSTLKRVAT